MRFSDGVVNVTAWATRRPGGFTDDHLEIIETILPVFTLVAEIETRRAVTRILLQTFLGLDAGRRVAHGRVRLGDSQRIHAVVFMCDFRDFTSITDQTDIDDVLEMLTSYYRIVVGAVREQGGEVLKFIGDAMLAVFRIPEGSNPQAACGRAMIAARNSQDRAAQTIAVRTEASLQPLQLGIGMHVGEVVYGNIGAENRLDFTVIGPAVNLVSRTEHACRDLGRQIVVTEAFAKHHGADLDDLGLHELRGVDQPVRLFGAALSSLKL